jgi:hypothetical protein
LDERRISKYKSGDLFPLWVKEHDNVYLTTQNNLGFKMGLACGEASQKLNKPAIRLEGTPIDLKTLTKERLILNKILQQKQGITTKSFNGLQKGCIRYKVPLDTSKF